MSAFNRREFVKLGGMAALISMAGGNAFSRSQPNEADLNTLQKAVKFSGDGIDMTPLEYSHLLLKLAKRGEIKADNYCSGGIVEKLEQQFSKRLGKERAIFLPTGTLANHLAVRKLAREKKKVIVQAESHIYKDSGYCAQMLSGLDLIPLGPQQATFTLDDIKKVLDRTDDGGAARQVGVISVESPVRRKYNEVFNYEEMKKISAFARSKGIKLHMDGARLFIASAHTGIPPNEYASFFDTVYISLYKCFNAASGAVLAGPKKFIENLLHLRKMFGGGMYQVWPFAAIALRYVDGFIEEYSKALGVAETFFDLLRQNGVFRVERIPNGTNVFGLHISGADLQKFRGRLRRKNKDD